MGATFHGPIAGLFLLLPLAGCEGTFSGTFTGDVVCDSGTECDGGHHDGDHDTAPPPDCDTDTDSDTDSDTDTDTDTDSDTDTDTGAGEEVSGRMTGGGSVFDGDMRVTHGFELHCDPADGPNNLEINWRDDAGAHRFHLTGLTSATCTDDPAIDPGQPAADFDTYEGSGVGRLDGADGAIVTFTFTDAGEPGKGADWATIRIESGQTTVLDVSNELDGGNQQAH